MTDASPRERPDDFVLTATGDQIFGGVIALGSAIFLVVVTVVMVVQQGAVWLLLLVGAALFGYVGYRMTRLSVRAGSRGIDVRNEWVRFRFDWNDVFEIRVQRTMLGLRIGGSQGAPGSVLVVVTLDQGERITRMAASFIPRGERDAEQQRRADRLNAMRKRYSTREW